MKQANELWSTSGRECLWLFQDSLDCILINMLIHYKSTAACLRFRYFLVCSGSLAQWKAFIWVSDEWKRMTVTVCLFIHLKLPRRARKRASDREREERERLSERALATMSQSPITSNSSSPHWLGFDSSWSGLPAEQWGRDAYPICAPISQWHTRLVWDRDDCCAPH